MGIINLSIPQIFISCQRYKRLFKCETINAKSEMFQEERMGSCSVVAEGSSGVNECCKEGFVGWGRCWVVDTGNSGQ